LGEPYVLWANLGYNGRFVLYDNGETALSQTYLRPGWYRITGLYSEILSSHLYRFTSAGLNSNQLPVMVDTGGYPTGFGLTGRVVDISGNGIPGVKVVISGSDGGVFTTTTSAQGYYGFDAPSGTYTVTAELPGYSFTPSTARVWTGTVSVAQTITGYAAGAQPPTTQATQTPAGAQVYDSQPYGSQLYTGDLAGYTGWVQGKLTDQSGAPISQAVIRADSLRTSVTSDAQGNYKIALNPGMHRIDAEKAGYGIPLRAVLVLSGQTSTLDLIGTRAATLGSGR
jgi:protocatechuate 3,4-dioxygenase beta subunit